MEDIQNEVQQLAHQAWPFPKKPFPRGATDENMDGFAARMRVSIPDELRAWLRFCNGAVIGPGGVYGLADMIEEYEFHPEWILKGWIPVAGDGCGDPYVLDTTITAGNTHPVYFIDHEIYEGEANYVVASGLWVFLRFLLINDRENRKAFQSGEDYDHYWPFDKERVLAEDSNLAHYEGDVPLAWVANERSKAIWNVPPENTE